MESVHSLEKQISQTITLTKTTQLQITIRVASLNKTLQITKPMVVSCHQITQTTQATIKCKVLVHQIKQLIQIVELMQPILQTWVILWIWTLPNPWTITACPLTIMVQVAWWVTQVLLIIHTIPIKVMEGSTIVAQVNHLPLVVVSWTHKVESSFRDRPLEASVEWVQQTEEPDKQSTKQLTERASLTQCTGKQTQTSFHLLVVATAEKTTRVFKMQVEPITLITKIIDMVWPIKGRIFDNEVFSTLL